MALEIDSPAEDDDVSLPLTVRGTCSAGHTVRISMGDYSNTELAADGNYSFTIRSSDTMFAGPQTIEVTCPPDERQTVQVNFGRG